MHARCACDVDDRDARLGHGVFFCTALTALARGSRSHPRPMRVPLSYTRLYGGCSCVSWPCMLLFVRTTPAPRALSLPSTSFVGYAAPPNGWSIRQPRSLIDAFAFARSHASTTSACWAGLCA